jgi:DNA-directed RNA polymerase specialized sigma24 family protein
MVAPVPRSAAEQDRYITEVYALLTKYAAEHARADRAADIVHGVAAKIIEKVRTGTWVYPKRLDEALMRTLLVNHRKNKSRDDGKAAARGMDYVRARQLELPAWMRADQSLTEESIWELKEVVLRSLPVRCSEAFRLVHDEEFSYEDAATLLRVSTRTVASDLRMARHALRQAAMAKGLVADGERVNKRTLRSRRKREYKRFAPVYPKPVSETQEPAPSSHEVAPASHERVLVMHER